MIPPLYPALPEDAAGTWSQHCDRNGAETAPGRRYRRPRLRMRENVLGVPAIQIELCPGRQEFETGLRQPDAALARQHGVEPLAQAMQMQHVGSGVGQLCLA